MTIIYRQVTCRWCGVDLHHKATGRGKRFCATRCRMAYRRAIKRNARAFVDAIEAGVQPPTDEQIGAPIHIAQYVVASDGTVTLRGSRPFRNRPDA